MPTFNSNQLLTNLQQQTENFLNEAIQQWQMLPTIIMLHKEVPEKLFACNNQQHQ